MLAGWIAWDDVLLELLFEPENWMTGVSGQFDRENWEIEGK